MKVRTLAAVSGSLLLLISLVFVACEHQTPITAPPVQVQPTLSSIQTNIFTPKCAIPGCHTGGNPTGQLSLQTGQSYNTLVGAGGTGVTSSGYGPRLRVQPGNANNSVLYLKVSGNTLGGQMPQGMQALSAAEMSAIQTWINNGAQNN